jgi:hypothetical protein
MIDVQKLARDADPFGEDGRLFYLAAATPETLERFAALVAAAEREACAKVCEEQAREPECPERAQYCADAIRSRSTP